MSNLASQVPLTPDQAARKARLSILAKAPQDRVLALWSAYLDDAPEPEHTILRAPEIGTVMVRGRAGGTGAPFNLGEMSVTRCSVRLKNGAVGHGYVQGRGTQAARTVALIDALAEAGEAERIEQAITQPLVAAAEAHRAGRAAKAAATQVEFFTMVRGEN